MKIPSVLLAVSLGLVALLSSGCASLVKGRTQSVIISSIPTGATVSIAGMPQGVTPLTVKLERGKAHRIEVRKAGFAPGISAVFPVANEFDRKYFRWGIDYKTGAMTDLAPETVFLTLRPANLPYERGSDPMTAMAERALEADALLRSGQISPADHKVMIEQIVNFYSQ